VARTKRQCLLSKKSGKFLGLLDARNLNVTAVYLDRQFFNSKCLTLMQGHNYA